MITSYGGKNCWSFNDWFEINFKINKNVPAEYGFRNKSVVPIMCFEGPNASGKTSALKVLSFISDFCTNSFSYSPKQPVPYDTFYNNEDDAEFFVSFYLPDDMMTEYTYEAVFCNKKVKSEKLTSARGKEKKTVFQRKQNAITKINLNKVTEFKNPIRDNASVLSTLYQYEVKDIIPFTNFFESIVSNISYMGRGDENTLLDPAEFYSEHADKLERVVKELKKMDTGINDIKIESFVDQQNKKVFYSVVYNETEDSVKPLNYWAMSTGSKVLYSKLNDIFFVLDNGGILLFDELDCHLHSSLVPILLNYFLNEEINTRNAQLVFTSHDSSLLDILKKYRTYIFEKQKGESICYRIDELPASMTARNDRSLEQTYKSGVLGGLPNA